MFARTIDLLGEEGFDRLRRSFVVVVGLGGVGSHTVVGLARAGVGRLRIVDADRVTASSLNRHAMAVAGDVGRRKTVVVGEWLESLGSAIEVEVDDVFVDAETIDHVLRGGPDLIVDAIDSVGPKTSLLAACVASSLPVISSMGASSRTDPTRIRVGDISETTVCPLARRVRIRLRRLGVTNGITAVYSTERPRSPLPPDDEEETIRRGRIRHRQPSLSTLPGIFGYVAGE